MNKLTGQLLRFINKNSVRQFSVGTGQKIGFIGLGNMGAHMANNLLKNDHTVQVFDLNKEAIQKVVNNGGKVSTPLDIAKECDVIVTMLPSSPHVKKVYCDPSEGLLTAVRPGTLLIDSSTIDPGTAKYVAEEANSKDTIMVDAPVSGGVGGAEMGTLTFMVGGSESAFNRAKPILSNMGQNIVHCGDAGTGQVAKVCNNLVLGISMFAVSEGMNLGVKSGMDAKKLAGIFNTSSARCWSSDTYNPCPGVMESVPASNGYKGGFGVDLMKKDLSLALSASEDAKSAIPLGNMVHEMYGQISEGGNGKKDFGYAYEYIKNKALD